MNVVGEVMDYSLHRALAGIVIERFDGSHPIPTRPTSQILIAHTD